MRRGDTLIETKEVRLDISQNVMDLFMTLEAVNNASDTGRKTVILPSQYVKVDFSEDEKMLRLHSEKGFEYKLVEEVFSFSAEKGE